jgi:hypothetical protein
MAVTNGVSHTGASGGFPHWSFIFSALLWFGRAGRHCYGLGLLEGLDTSPLIGYPLIGPRVSVSQTIQCWLSVACITRTALPRDLNEAERSRLADGRADRMTLNAELYKMIVRARQAAILFRPSTVTIKLDFEPI